MFDWEDMRAFLAVARSGSLVSTARTLGLKFTLTVNNLLGKSMPNVGSGVGGTSFNNGNTFPTTYDPISRSYTIGGRITF